MKVGLTCHNNIRAIVGEVRSWKKSCILWHKFQILTTY